MSTTLAMLEPESQSSHSEGKLLGAEITKLCSYIYAAEARLLDLVRLFDKKKYWQELGLCSCAHWLNFKCGIGMNAAREKVRVAHALADLPKISLAFGKGELSYSKVRAMTRIADETNEDYLVMVARHGTAHHVEKLVSKFRNVKKLNAQDHVGLASDRELTHYYDDAGCLIIKARMPAEQGALIVQALEMAMDKDFDENDVYPKGTSTAVTFEPIAERRADALAQIAETYLNNSELSGSTADRYQVVVHVYPKGAWTAETSEIEGGPHVTAETSRRIGCDSSVVRIKEDENGEPLSIGRRSRLIPPPMRRALRARDKGCRFPGCTNTRFVDGHHITYWSDGGETNLDNLVSLCRHHHHLVHEGGFRCEKDASGNVVFKDWQARPLERSSVLSGLTTKDDVQEWLDRQFFEARIDSESCPPRWYAGERMDWEMAVSALF